MAIICVLTWLGLCAAVVVNGQKLIKVMGEPFEFFIWLSPIWTLFVAVPITMAFENFLKLVGLIA